MSTITSPDDLLRLAPDARTLEAGRKLFYSRRWRLLGGDGQWLWGEFVYGSDMRGKAIESAVQLTTGRFVCSCRGRQRPCAHGLALILMLKNAQERISVAQPPAWVRTAQLKADRAATPRKASEDAEFKQPASRVKRLELMTEGVAALDVRLTDIVSRGIADAMARGPEPFRAAAAQLTDAKLPGPAGRLRRLAHLAGPGSEVREEAEVGRILGDLYLFVRAWQKRSELPEKQYDELLQYAGLNTPKGDVLARAGLNDHWLVLGTVLGQEDRLRFRRTWLRGENSRRFALLLDYAFGERAFERAWPLAASFSGRVHYYPGSYPQRAVFADPAPGGKPYDGLAGYSSFAAMRENYRKALAFNPWLAAYPVFLESVRPVQRGKELLLVDDDGIAYPLVPTYENFYTLLAIGGGGPVSLFGEFDGYRILPLSLVTELGVVKA